VNARLESRYNTLSYMQLLASLLEMHEIAAVNCVLRLILKTLSTIRRGRLLTACRVDR